METASGAVVGWRLRADLVGHPDGERAENLERRAGRVAGALLLGLALNAALGWWWADPAAALAIVPLVVREGLEGWRGEESH